jgi:low affinity Fe/Cu permease
LRKAPAGRESAQAVFGRFADSVTRWTGSPAAFFIAVVLLLAWALCGPWFDYSETWQLVVNTGTTIVTFLMVFVIQQSQNKDSHAVHLKLDELLCANKTADNALIDAEHLDAEELDRIAQRYAQMADSRRTGDRNAGDRKTGVRNSHPRLGRRRDRLAKGLAGFTSQQRPSAGKRKSSSARRGRKAAGVIRDRD